MVHGRPHSSFLRLREQTAQPRAELPFKVTAVSGGCRLAWLVTGSACVKRRETRCEGRGLASGHKRGHEPLPSPRLSPVAAGRRRSKATRGRLERLPQFVACQSVVASFGLSG